LYSSTIFSMRVLVLQRSSPASACCIIHFHSRWPVSASVPQPAGSLRPSGARPGANKRGARHDGQRQRWSVTPPLKHQRPATSLCARGGRSLGAHARERSESVRRKMRARWTCRSEGRAFPQLQEAYTNTWAAARLGRDHPHAQPAFLASGALADPPSIAGPC
jgi:hypothetical protein